MLSVQGLRLASRAGCGDQILRRGVATLSSAFTQYRQYHTGITRDNQLCNNTSVTPLTPKLFKTEQVASFRQLPQSAQNILSPAAPDVIASYEELKQDSLRRGKEPPTLLTSPFAVHCNNELDLEQVGVFGFDYDYTLANYSSKLGELIYQEALRSLVDDFHYPAHLCKDLKYDEDFAIRGLHYDTRHGLLLKIDAYNNIQMDTVHRGHTQLSEAQIRSLYVTQKLSKVYVERNMRQLTDIFSLPEARLLADVSRALHEAKAPFDPEYPYQDVRECVRRLHVSGHLHSLIMADIARYLKPNPRLVQYLSSLRTSGKDLFLLTNSPFHFVDAGMRVIFDSDQWREMFDVVVVNSDKPRFFSSHRPFRILDTDVNTPLWEPINKNLGFEPGKVYWSGNVQDFMKMSNWRGRSILYFGDHVYNDLLDPAEMEYGWHTGAIVRELEDEISIQNSVEFQSRLRWLSCLNDLISKLQMATGGSKTGILVEWVRERDAVMKSLKSMFNERFGSVFRGHVSPTFFADNLTQFADIYTSRVENLGAYPTNYHFHPKRFRLPHESTNTAPLKGPRITSSAPTQKQSNRDHHRKAKGDRHGRRK